MEVEQLDLEKETLILSDDKVFYTIEGEGEYVGQPSVFMRLAMCNLTCKGFASEDSPHGCDSYISWSVKNKMTFNEIFTLFDNGGFVKHLKKGAILKLTGGEPLIQQKQLIKFIRSFNEIYGFYPQIDFETNATIMPLPELAAGPICATFTTSPKLSSNGDPETSTYKPEVLEYHANNYSGFKFVINVAEDIDEIWRKYVEVFKIPLNRIWFMPCAGSRSEHIERAPVVAEYAKAMHVNFSPRLHLLLWDKALKV